MKKPDPIFQSIYNRPAELLQQLIRFDTTNPPGNEAPCINYIDSLLTSSGLDSTILGKEPNRPNLIARLQGEGLAPPLLLYGHVDVVPAAKQDWAHPPFEGNLVDGYVWGRGALDMKSGIAMMLSAVLKAKAEGLKPAGDIVLAVLSDEEAGGDFGAAYLVENHAGQFSDIRYALGEFGGFPIYMAGKKFYAIEVAQKQICWMRASVHGPAGHGSIPMRGGATAKLARVLQNLDQNRLPIHITPTTQDMLKTMSAQVPDPVNTVLSQLLEPATADQVLDSLGPLGLTFDAMLHNTVNVTMIQGGSKVNVIPSEIVIELDGRILPGFSSDDMMDELKVMVDENVELEIVRYDPGPDEPDMGMFDTLGSIIREADPEGIPVPYLLSGSSDARFFSKLGIQTYGFIPMNLPPDFNFVQHIHGADERVPAEAVSFGSNVLYQVLKRYGK
jgi:acetylornithine deacetylase/succinyl-diaminopimelate desuccinylase-like protein